MRELDRLADLVERVIDGDPWHGPNVRSLLSSVSAAQAASHPVPGAHSLWELVLHMTGWTREVRARLGGAAAGEPASGDWPVVSEVTPEAWTAALSALLTAHHELAADIRGADDGILDRPVVDTRDPAAGRGLSQYVTLHGLVHHTTYHAGQLALIGRAIAAGAN